MDEPIADSTSPEPCDDGVAKAVALVREMGWAVYYRYDHSDHALFEPHRA